MMADENTDIEALLLNQVLDSFRNEFSDLSDTWKLLDTKAQGLAAVTGVFLAALIGWATSTQSDIKSSSSAVLILGILLLLIAMIASVLALLIRRVAAPHFAETLAKMVADITSRDGKKISAETIINFTNDQLKIWSTTNANIRSHLEWKAFDIHVGQIAFLGAAIAISTQAVVAVLS